MSTGSATLDPDVLVDDLVADIDELRALQDEFGIRAFRLYGVTRTWTEGEVGVGDYVDTIEEFTPRPLIEPFTEYRNELRPCGLDEGGLIRVSEVSLRNNFADLTGAAPNASLPAGVERLFLVREGYGQGQPDRHFTLDRPPFPDRVKTLGWMLWLRRVRT